MISRLTTVTVLATLLTAPSLAAQHEQHRQHGDSAGERGMMGTMQGQMQETMPGMAMHAFAPARLLAKRAELGLTPDQVTRIEQLQAETKQIHDQAMASHGTHRDRMLQALGTETPDSAAVRTHFAAAHHSMGEAHWAELGAGLKAMAVLTAAQRAKVKSWAPASSMQGHHEQ